MSIFNSSIESIMRDVNKQREVQYDEWYKTEKVGDMKLEELNILFERLLRKKKVDDTNLHTMKIDRLAQRIDQMLNPSGMRMLSREEQSAEDMTRLVDTLTLFEQISERINNRRG